MVDTRTDGMSGLSWVALVLVIVGALNWALVGLFDWNLVAALFGTFSALTRIVYVLVGLSGLYLIFLSTRLVQRPRA
ncbi:DUF378 domain-containing protein [Polyangium jinanense]|uniref:DUF378 domain-containing protein n=1 Tax=Polyangium jinanense TaxID=2829994 RepID=A0A9X3X3C4_9BACT|nr:DUF378 domain-containing protein [Polyangium jinanense]MDC3956092.1 DUF378 domain-containing protein [Polyangium jinanense]MDC3982877.1 DUF378 domain-containing protein [Polyangium jinanense]